MPSSSSRRPAPGLRYALCLLATLLFASGCSESPPQAPPEPSADLEPQRGGTVVVTNLADIDTVNPLLSTNSSISRDVHRLLFLWLARERPDFDQGPPSFAPALAESWELSDDRRTLTFHLRPDAVWSDGVPITAADVRWTWQAQTSPDVAFSRASYKEAIADVEVVDDHTVRFHFDADSADPVEAAVEGAVLPRHVWGELPLSEWRRDARWFVDHMVSSGPFVLERWEPSQEIVLGRNERYLEPGLPRLDRFVVRILPDKTGQINQLLGGSVHYVQIVPPDQIERLEASDRVELDTFWARQFDYLCWNTALPPFDDAEVRRALTRAIDRQTIIDSIYRGYARPSVSPILSSTWGFDPSLEPWPYDPLGARDALEARGFTDADGDGTLERDGEPLSIELLTGTGNKVHVDAATMIQEQLRRVGVEVRLRPLEFQTWLQRLRDHDFDAAIGGWNIPTSLDVGYAFHSDSIDGYNFGSYSNRELDELIDRASAEADVEAKRRILYRIQRILHDEQPYTFLWEPQQINGRDRRLRDTRPNALSSFYNLPEWWLAPAV